MKRVSLLALLCVATSVVSCQHSAKNTGPLGPDSGTFSHSTYRNDFFGFSYSLSREWHRSRVSPAPLPGGGYYLFIADRNTGELFLNRVIVIADPESRYQARLSPQRYLSDFIRAEVEDSHGEIIRQLSLSFQEEVIFVEQTTKCSRAEFCCTTRWCPQNAAVIGSVGTL